MRVIPSTFSRLAKVMLSSLGISLMLVATSGAANIKGKVTGPDGLTPLAGVSVTASKEYFYHDVQTALDGTYDISGLSAGEYSVFFDPNDNVHASEYYDNQQDLSSATSVVVAESGVVSGINASLAIGSRITGTVTGPNGITPLNGIHVSVYQDSEYIDSFGHVDWDLIGSSSTDSNGNYDIGGLIAGTYRLTFKDGYGTYAPEAYNNATDLDSGTDLVVPAAGTLPNINASLAVGSNIRGKVTGSDGVTPLAGVWVSADGENGFSGYSQTASDGTYDIGGLSAGNYRVHFSANDNVHLSEYYDNQTDWSEATPVVVGASAIVPGINASLAVSSSITGTVTGPDGTTRLEGIFVDAYSWNYEYWDSFVGWSGGAWQWKGYGYTDSYGNYDISGLLAGTYRIEFSDWDEIYATEAYNNASDLDTGIDLVVPTAATVPNINASLDLIRLSPVYRFWSPVFSGHFFTRNETEKNNIISGLSAYWTYEGIAYDAYTGQAEGMLPVYRFWSPVFSGHFYTMNETEKNNIISGLSAYWTYEGIAWYACPTQVAGTVPVYRFWSPVFAHHFFTINETEKNNIIAGLSAYWTYEGIAYYAFSSRSGSDSRAVDLAVDESDFAAVQKSADAIVAGSEVAAPVNVIQTLNGSSTGLGDMVFPMLYAGGAVKAYVYDATADQWTCVVSNSNAQADAVFTGVQPDRGYRFEVWSDQSAGSDAAALHSSSFVWKLDPPATLNSDVTLSDGDGVVGAPVARLKTPTTDGTLTLKLYSSSQGVIEIREKVFGGDTAEFSLPSWNRWYWVGGWRDTDNALVMSLWMRHETAE